MIRLILITFLFSSSVYADFKFNDLTGAELGKISKDFSANFMFTSVSPAHGNGNLLSLEVGIVGNVTESEETEKVIKRVDPSQSLDYIGSAYGLVTFSIPFGFTFELGIVPETEIGDGKVEYLAGALKWYTKLVPLVDIGVRGHFSNGDFGFSQTISGVNTTVGIENSVKGLDVIVSSDLLILEPYLGLGYVTGETTVNATGSVIFNSTEYSSSPSSVTVDDSSMRVFAGLQIDLFLMRIAAEYARMFDTTRISGKLSFYF